MDCHKPGLAALVLSWLGASGAAAQASSPVLEFDIEPFHSRVEFAVPFMGLTTVKGAFEDFGGLLVYRPENPARSSITFVIRTASLHSGNERRDTHLRSDDFLDAERYPTIQFQSDRVTPRGAARYTVGGRLTIHGVTRRVDLPVRVRHRLVRSPEGVDYLGFDLGLKLDWRTFGIPAGNRRNGWFQPARMLVNDSVAVEISIEADRRIPSRIHYPGLDHTLQVVETEGPGELVRRYQRIRGASPDSTAGFVGPLADVGRALVERGRLEDGLAVLRLNLEAAPGDPDALTVLARASLAAGDSAAASRLYRDVLAVDPAHPAALEMLRHMGQPHATP